MDTIRTLVMALIRVGIATAFAGLGALGLGLMVGALRYQPGPFWGSLVFLVGLLGVLLAAAAAMTITTRPRTRPA